MNKDSKKSLILVLVLFLVSSIFYFGYRFAQKMDGKFRQLQEITKNAQENVEAELIEAMSGEWINEQNGQSWIFISDTLVQLNGKQLKMKLEFNFLTIDKSSPDVYIVQVENDTTLKMTPVTARFMKTIDEKYSFSLKQVN